MGSEQADQNRSIKTVLEFLPFFPRSCSLTEALGKQYVHLLLFTFHIFFKEVTLPLDQMPVPNRACLKLCWIHSLSKSLFLGNLESYSKHVVPT